jgi:hypothetical protein
MPVPILALRDRSSRQVRAGSAAMGGIEIAEQACAGAYANKFTACLSGAGWPSGDWPATGHGWCPDRG